MPGMGEGEHALVLETERRLSESLLWRAQRDYFEREGVEAWRTSTVPHYVTNNPALAGSVAQVVFGFLRDCFAPGAPGSGQPVHILELGAGSGRFGFLFLRALLELLAHSPLKEVPFRYVMTDFAESNIAFWRTHPALVPFVSAGLLDFALLDVEDTRELRLQESGEALGAGSLDKPLVVLANYVFDSVPQDAFSFESGGLRECRVSVTTFQPGLDLKSAEVFSHLRLDYHHRPVGWDYYPEREFNDILRDYAGKLDRSTVLFPVMALRCVERLARLAGGRLLLVSGDKGDVDEAALLGAGDPALAVHGSFSFSVNYHAVGEWFRRRGGEVLRTRHRQVSLHVSAYLLGVQAADETRCAYRMAFDGPSSDDFFRLRQGIQEHYPQMGFEPLLSHVRMSRYDPRILRDCLPVLAMLASGLSREERKELVSAVQRTWENYYFLGEPQDLPFDFAVLLHELGEYETASGFFRESLRLFGEQPETWWNLAMCQFALGHREEAVRHLARVWELAPDFKLERLLLAKKA